VKHSDARTLARNLALDRDGVIAGGSGATANIDVARILNDHISWYGADDRGVAYKVSQTGYGDDYGYDYGGTPGNLFSIATGSFSSQIALTTILRILAVTRETTFNTTDGTPLDIVQPAEIYHARSKSVTTGTPTMVAFVRLAGYSNLFRAIVHPPPASTTYFAVYVQLCNPEFTVTTIDDTEVMDYPQTAQYAIVRETALDLAIILRRPDSTWDAIKSRLADSRELTDNIAARST
jgi:hypothetical protein